MSESLQHVPLSNAKQAALEYELLQYINSFAQLSDEEARAIVAGLKPKMYKKGQILLKEGQVADLCLFVLKGCIRQYYLIDGVEKTSHFYTEGMPVAPYEGAYKRSPSKYYLACVEETIVSIGQPGDEERLFGQFPRLEEISRMATEEEWGKTQDHLAQFVIHSPEERYKNLLETRPDLIDRVPQYHLASFLGITPESLSRIRKRMMMK